MLFRSSLVLVLLSVGIFLPVVLVYSQLSDQHTSGVLVLETFSSEPLALSTPKPSLTL